MSGHKGVDMSESSMIGKKGYYGKWCKCCGWDDHKLVKVRERRQWKKEIQEDLNE